MKRDIVIIGGGPAGLAAALAAKEAGAKDVLILERDVRLGGILNQCIHNGFGLHTFKEELTGPEYAARFEDRVRATDAEIMLSTMVLSISPERVITAVSKENGLFTVEAGAVILAMGCRERSRGALNIPGFRPAGVFSAGTAQRLVNMEGQMPGREVVILGSGDIGLIMARRMTLEGAKVRVVAELQPYSGGLKRNIVQCLDDYGIPLKLSHTVTEIHGKDRVTGVTISRVDESLKPIPGTEEYYSCDTLLLSVGLLPENELSTGAGVTLSRATNGPEVNERLMTNVPGIFACGNVLHVHDLVDYVSEEAAAAGKAAAEYIKESLGHKDSHYAVDTCEDEKTAWAYVEANAPAAPAENAIPVSVGGGVRYTVPSTIDPEHMPETLTVRFRVGNIYKNCYVSVYFDGERTQHRKKQVMAPGEMEQVILKRSDLLGKNIKKITVMTETD